VLFLAVCLIEQQSYLALSLYLALLLGALSILRRVRPMLIILCFYSLLLLGFSYASFVSMQIEYKLGLSRSVPSWEVTNYTALILFVIGYLLLYAQQLYTHKRIAAYANRVEELTRLTERQRLARELHDTLSQGLVGLSLQLDAIDALLTRQRPARAQEVVRQAMERARSTLAETRFSLDTLRAEEKHASVGIILSERLHEQVTHFTSSTGLECHVETSNLAAFPSVLQEPVLRMITEGLTNVARHARAQQVEICICQHKQEIVIDVCDDGVGFDPTLADRETGHYGLLGLRERVRSLGGQMQIESAVGEGTRLRFTIPLA
jgi:NarL family two-component system sensor histidine kinase YdfH